MQKFFEAGPWSLFILLSASLMKVLVYGTAFSIGLYTVEFRKYFDTSLTNASLVGAINLAVFRFSGPFVGLLLKKFSYRTVAITGGLLSLAGTLTVVFERDIPMICVSYGIIAGFGFCTCYLVSSVMIGVYFNKYKAIASAIIESGAPLGLCIIPFFLNQVIEEYTWIGSFYIISCLTAQLIVLGTLLRMPPAFQSLTRTAIHWRHKTQTNELVEARSECNSSVAEQNEPVVPSVCRNMALSSNCHEDKNEELGESFYAPPLVIPKRGCQSELMPTSSEEHIAWPQNHHRQLPPSDAHVSRRVLLRLFKNVSSYCKVLGNIGFVSFTISWTLLCFVLAAFIGFLPAFILSLGLTASDAARLLTIMYGVAAISSIPSGFLINSKHINVTVLYVIASIALGIVFLLFNYFNSYNSIVIIVIIGGALNGLLFSTRVIIVLDLVGTEHVSDALGFKSFANGFGFLAGPPVAGYLYDVTKGFDAMFYCLFGVQCLAGSIMTFYVMRKKYSSQKWFVARG